MILRGLKLVNFGPFLGEHDVDLSISASAPVIVIHGENMRGKTSFLNAVKWCLYGDVTDRRGRILPRNRLISYDAIERREYHMSVHLDFEHGGKRYLMERHVQSEVPPSSPRHLTETLYLKRDGHILPVEQVVEEIRNILHPAISRFFLFDGEMLGEYEVLLGDTNRSTALVRESIEQILGVPALQIMAEDLGDLRRDAEKRQLQAVEAAKSSEQLVAEAQQVTNEVEALDRDLIELEDLRVEIETQIDDLRDDLDAYADVQADAREADRLDELIDRSREDQKALRAEVRELFGTSWWLPTVHLASDRLTEVTRRVKEETERVKSIAAAEFELVQLEAAEETGQCPLCGQALADHSHDTIGSRKTELEEMLSDVGSTGRDLGVLAATLDDLRPFTDPTAFVELREKEAAFRKLGITIRRSIRAVEGIRERLREHDIPTIREIEIKYEKALGQRDSITSDIKKKTKRRNELRDDLSRLNQEIQRLPGADPKTAAEADLYGGLEAVFSRAIDQYREALRTDVEERATDIFRQLTTEDDYAGLSINDQYGLSIVDVQGRAISERSAGAEQVVALSLIGALNASAVREGPVVMDTPFGRLDVSHRENILSYLPTMSPQVVLLVQSGEVQSGLDLQPLEGLFAREYWLARDGSPTRSRFDTEPIDQ